MSERPEDRATVHVIVPQGAIPGWPCVRWTPDSRSVARLPRWSGAAACAAAPQTVVELCGKAGEVRSSDALNQTLFMNAVDGGVPTRSPGYGPAPVRVAGQGRLARPKGGAEHREVGSPDNAVVVEVPVARVAVDEAADTDPVAVGLVGVGVEQAIVLHVGDAVSVEILAVPV